MWLKALVGGTLKIFCQIIITISSSIFNYQIVSFIIITIIISSSSSSSSNNSYNNMVVYFFVPCFIIAYYVAVQCFSIL